MFTIAAFYHFTAIGNPVLLREGLVRVCAGQDVRGTVLVAAEGVNGTIAGSRAGVDALLAHLRSLPGLAMLEHKESAAPAQPFSRMKVKLKREIVTMGQPQVDPLAGTGHYVGAAEWNALIAQPDVAVIDTRNEYEVAIGSFKGAVDPGTRSFRDFPGWWQQNRDRFAGKRIAMFCTGGIRCEKATNYLIGQGVADVFHLKGGILKYLEEMPEAESRWQGECYVFDGRVSVGHGLKPGTLDTCHACRRPLSADDTARPEYERGTACHRCADEYTEADRARFRERQRQIDLASRRGESHLGG